MILSGTGSDGTLGARAIKAEGGIAFAQDPASAAYDGMPRSAIASGCVDFVLPPERIAQELSRLSRHPYVITPQPGEERADEPPLSAPKGKDGLRAILTLLRRTTGADFSAYKPPTIKRRIARRMALAHVETLEEYARYLEGHADEAQALHQDCLITVTSFFRDPGTYQALSQEVLPRLVKDRPPGAPVRVWVPGCATGEEVYSIVICLLEGAAELKANPSFQVFGTDLSESALEKARAGRYLPNIAQDVSPERLQRFFTEVDGGYQVIKAIRDMCVFARHDVTRDPPFSRMDLISCRNMLIYLEPRMQQRVMAIFHYALLTSGFLLLGASETASASQDLFAPVDKKHRIYLKRPTAAPAVFGFGAPRAGGPEEQEARPVAAKPGPREELPREADRILLARYAPAGVIVDEKDNIVEFRGETEPYLEHGHGRASLNLFKMARKGLLLEIRQAIQEARKKDAPVRKEGVSLRHRGQVRRLDLEVVPLRGSPEKERSLLVLFEARPETRSPSGRRAAARPRADGAEAKENAKLRRELAEATRYLQAVTQQHEAANEELQASNEEVLSANEELQSINEELETAKEELQASNEELATLNQELQGRNLQLERALEYANGIVETVRNPLLILDAGLRVERANRSLLRLLPGHARGDGREARLRAGRRAVGHPRAAADAGRASSPRPPGSRTSRSSTSSRGSGVGPWWSTRASCAARAARRASCWSSRTGPRPGTRKGSARRCSPWSSKRGSGPSRPTGSRTSSWRRSRTSCGGRSAPWWDGCTSCARAASTRPPGSAGWRPSSGASRRRRGSSRTCSTTRGWSRASFTWRRS